MNSTLEWKAGNFCPARFPDIGGVFHAGWELCDENWILTRACDPELYPPCQLLLVPVPVPSSQPAPIQTNHYSHTPAKVSLSQGVQKPGCNKQSDTNLQKTWAIIMLGGF